MTNNKEHNSYISNLTEEINIPKELHKFLLTVPCNRTVTDIQLNKRYTHTLVRVNMKIQLDLEINGEFNFLGRQNCI